MSERMRGVALIVVAAACQGYRAGAFRGLGHEFTGERLTVGCLDVAIEAVADPAAEGTAVGFTLGNRCDAAVRVDLRAATATVHYRDGRAGPAVPFDPRRELRPAWLEARSIAREVIEYQAPHDAGPPFEVCLDLARIDTSEPSPLPVTVCIPTATATDPDPALARREAP